MATITIKIDSEELARDVLEHLGYLPEDEVPDLESEDDEDWIPPPPKPVLKTGKSTKFVD